MYPNSRLKAHAKIAKHMTFITRDRIQPDERRGQRQDDERVHSRIACERRTPFPTARQALFPNSPAGRNNKTMIMMTKTTTLDASG